MNIKSQGIIKAIVLFLYLPSSISCNNDIKNGSNDPPPIDQPEKINNNENNT